MAFLRPAEIDEAEEILKFYQDLICTLNNSEFKPKWNLQYPNLTFIKNSIEKNELFIYKKK